MREIDGKKYMSAKEYAELKKMNTSRVSQLKSSGELPFKDFADLGISLIDFELLNLSNQEKRFAVTKFQIPVELHTLSILDTGRYFMRTLFDLTEYKISTEIAMKELVESFKNVNLEKENLEKVMGDLERNIDGKAKLLQSYLEQIEDNKQTIKGIQEQLSELEKNQSGLVKETDNLKNQIEDKNLLIKDLESKNTSVIFENHSLKESNQIFKEALKNNQFAQTLSEIQSSLNDIKSKKIVQKNKSLDKT